MQRLQARDERAFNELVCLYQNRMFFFVLRFLGDRAEAEDLVQEVFVQVFKAIDQFRYEAKLTTWMYKIAVNLCKNRHGYLRRRYVHAQRQFDDVTERTSVDHTTNPSSIPRPDEALEGLRAERLVQETIQNMDDDFRYPLLLCDVEDLSYDEIAQITGLPLNTVRSRIHRARQQLRNAIESEFGDKQP